MPLPTASEERHRFCGVHFFNPPRYMHLAELIPARGTDPAVFEAWNLLTTTLGKGVVYAEDTPNFIGNRIGVFSILSVIHHTSLRPGLRCRRRADRPSWDVRSRRPYRTPRMWSGWTPWPT